MSGIDQAALRLAIELETCFDPVTTFVDAGGRLGFSAGANTAYLYGASGSSTISKDLAVKSWIRAVWRKAGAT